MQSLATVAEHWSEAARRRLLVVRGGHHGTTVTETGMMETCTCIQVTLPAFVTLAVRSIRHRASRPRRVTATVTVTVTVTIRPGARAPGGSPERRRSGHGSEVHAGS